MFGSRILPIVSKAAKFGIQSGNKGFSTSSVVKSSAPYHYRTFGEPPRRNVIYAEVMGAFMWWWIFWHLMTEPSHLWGHHPFPDASKWTDEELGVPPDDAEDPE